MRHAAFITPGAYPVPSANGGSVERVVEKVVPALLPDISPTIYGRVGTGLARVGRLRGVPVYRYPGMSKARYFRQVCGSLARTRPDIVQVENRPHWVPKLKKLLPASRIWLNLHSTTFINPPYSKRSLTAKCLRAADRIQVNSEFLREYIEARYPVTIGKIRVNPLGVDVSKFHGRSSPEGANMRERLRAERGWGNRPVVIYVGRLVPQKGIHHLLSAVPSILAAAPDTLFVIVGSARYGSHRRTAYSKRLRAMVAKRKRNVHFQPYVPHHDIPAWFAAADVAVVPSVGNEAFGLVNLEAMAAELPVVATRAGGMKEIVLDGSTGFLVSPDAPAIVGELAGRIGSLLANESLRKEMGRRGRERVLGQFQWLHTADRWVRFQKE